MSNSKIGQTFPLKFQRIADFSECLHRIANNPTVLMSECLNTPTFVLCLQFYFRLCQNLNCRMDTILWSSEVRSLKDSLYLVLSCSSANLSSCPLTWGPLPFVSVADRVPADIPSFLSFLASLIAFPTSVMV